MAQIWIALIHFLPVAYIKFLTKVTISLTEITSSLREQLMGYSHLLELLSLDRKALAKPPDWNAPRQLELFGKFMSCFFTGQQWYRIKNATY